MPATKKVVRKRALAKHATSPSQSMEERRDGHSDNPGSRLTEAFLQDVLADWEAHGTAAIACARAERPHDYLKLVTALLPKESKVKVDTLEELSDNQLAEQLARLVARIAATGAGSGYRTGPEAAPE